MNKTRPLTFENLTVLRRQAQTKRNELTTFQFFNTFFSGGDLNHNQNVKQKVSVHNFIIPHWHKSNLGRLKYVKVSQAVREGSKLRMQALVVASSNITVMLSTSPVNRFWATRSF